MQSTLPNRYLPSLLLKNIRFQLSNSKCAFCFLITNWVGKWSFSNNLQPETVFYASIGWFWRLSTLAWKWWILRVFLHTHTKRRGYLWKLTIFTLVSWWPWLAPLSLILTGSAVHCLFGFGWHKINSNHARVLGSPIFTINCTHFSSALWWVIHQSLKSDLDYKRGVFEACNNKNWWLLGATHLVALLVVSFSVCGKTQ